MIGFLIVLRINYQLLHLNETIWCRRYSNNNHDADNLIVELIIIIWPFILNLLFGLDFGNLRKFVRVGRERKRGRARERERERLITG